MKPSILLSFEMQSGTERLAEALHLRGFPVQVENDMITLRNGTEKDYEQLRWMMDKLAIPVFWNGNQCQLLINRFSIQKMREIIHFSGHEHYICVQNYQVKWRSFVNRRYGIRTNTADLDSFTAVLVKALNEAGIVTLAGCNGHKRYAPNFQLSGVYFGVWFSIIKQRYLSSLGLHYNWKVEFLGGSKACIVAHKFENEPWNMMKVLDDCQRIAIVLEHHAKEIREWKRNTFKRNMKSVAEPMRKAGDIKKLYRWMKEESERSLILPN